jgi:uncharacterized protein YrrD
MIKGSQLVGRAVIDMEAAERLGKIKEIIVQHDGERVAGFVVVHGETIVGTGGTRRMIPASALHSIGPDAITVRGSGTKERLAPLENLPRMSDIIGRKMVTRSGRLLGLIDDMLINGADGTITGFVVGEGMRNRLENMFNPRRSRVRGYVRADADLQVGKELIVVPDDALIEGQPGAHGHEHHDKPDTQSSDQEESRRWGERSSGESTRASIWTRRADAGIRTQPQTRVQPRIESETARAVENTSPAAPAQGAPEASGPAGDTEPIMSSPEDQRAQ